MISIALTKEGGYCVVHDGKIHSTHETAAEVIKERERLRKQLQRDPPETVTTDTGRH